MKFFNNVISLFKGRLNRRNFLIGNALAFLLSYISNIGGRFDGFNLGFVQPVILVFSISFLVRRARDVGWDKLAINFIVFWKILEFFLWVVVIILPLFDVSVGFIKVFGTSHLILTVLPLLIISIVLLFKRGQVGSNQYGDSPSSNIRFPQDILSGSGVVTTFDKK